VDDCDGLQCCGQHSSEVQFNSRLQPLQRVLPGIGLLPYEDRPYRYTSSLAA
jgi:hypothetical protein